MKCSAENQPENRRRTAGAISLSTRIQRIVEGDEKLPDIIDKTIKNAVGASKKPIDAMVIAGLLGALQGDKGWAEWLSDNGYGKPKERVEHSGDSDAPIGMTIKWLD